MKKACHIILLILLTGAMSTGYSQPPRSYVNQDPKVDQLVNLFRQQNLTRGMQGFRVQIFTASGNRSKLLTERQETDFNALYPGVRSYITYSEPYFRLRVGDFRTRMEAERFRNQVSSRYIVAIVVPDRINFPRLAETTEAGIIFPSNFQE